MSLLVSLRAATSGMRSAASSPTDIPRTTDRLATAGAIALATIAVLVSRRTTTLTQPYVWAEDGLDIVPKFALEGWSSLFDPVSGYMTVVARILSYTALTIAPGHYPIVSILLSWAFMAGVLAFIALAPTPLRAKPWLALACLFVPTDPEVFGTPLYSFWWAGLILMLLALWEYTPRHFGLRAGLAILCGLSTPIGILVTPLMALRALLLKTRHDAALAVIFCVCSALQMREIFAVHTNTAATEVSWRSFVLILDKFFGRFAWGMESANSDQQVWLAVLGAGLIGIVVYALAQLKDRWLAFALLYLLGGSVALSVMRVTVEIMSPTVGGPRYFFYPYVLLGWILIQSVTAVQRPGLRALFAAPLVLALVNAASSGWNHASDPISWRQHVLSCLHFDSYAMPIHLAGERQYLFRSEYPRQTCALLATGMTPLDENEVVPFTYRWFGFAAGSRLMPEIAAQTISGGSGTTSPERYKMLGSHWSAQETGSITLNLRRGDEIMFATGAGKRDMRYDLRTPTHHFQGDLPYCTQNCTLAFKSDLLPETFSVTLIDDGTAADEWFAIGIPEE